MNLKLVEVDKRAVSIGIERLGSGTDDYASDRGGGLVRFIVRGRVGWSEDTDESERPCRRCEWYDFNPLRHCPFCFLSQGLMTSWRDDARKRRGQSSFIVVIVVFLEVKAPLVQQAMIFHQNQRLKT